ncbi:MAG: hypothetical protein HY909_01010 [Deltaproteobacteria bacterium]|nr:hypothetical protein [Deltaproteobacteria bacterium]
MTVSLRGALLVWLWVLGCAGSRPPVAVASARGEPGALPELLPRLQGPSGRALARAWGIVLHPSQGATAITGERAEDDAVVQAQAPTLVGDTGVVLARTVCGNVMALGLRREAGRWFPTGVVDLVGDARPGQCRSTTVRAEARGLLGDLPREILVELRTVSDEGDDERGPELRVLSLSPDGRVTELSEPIPFGHTDEATGEVEQGEWAVEATLPAPRAVYVQLMPEHPQGAGQTLLRRTYGFRDGRLTLLEETRLPVRHRAP